MATLLVAALLLLIGGFGFTRPNRPLAISRQRPIAIQGQRRHQDHRRQESGG